MYQIFDTLEQYNQYTDNGTNLTSGVTYYVKEDGSSHFQTNNIDGEMKKYEMKNNEDLIDLIERDITTLNIPNGTTTIGGGAFIKCTGLTSVTIPNSVTSIGGSAFMSCTGLTSITIPDSVTSIEQQAFQNCVSLTSVTIPDSVTSIGAQTFYKCSGLTSVTIGSGVTSIGQNAFNGCTGLTSVTIEATNPPTLSSDAFSSTGTNLIIYVPAESVNTYKAATNWSNYADRIQAIPTV